METKRCAYCHKLQRASARLCSGCGHPFGPKPRSRSAPRQAAPVSIPPASPHRAGHYVGVHPEDQPYQSSMITAQHAVEPDVWSGPEPGQIILPAAETLEQVRPAPPLVKPPEWKMERSMRFPGLPERAVPVLLTASCLLFLLASSILAFILMGKHTSIASVAVWTRPDVVHAHDTFWLSGKGFDTQSLMTFTYDMNRILLDDRGYPLETHSDEQGNFSVLVHAPGDWQSGVHFVHVTDQAQKMSVTAKVTVGPGSVASTDPHLLTLPTFCAIF